MNTNMPEFQHSFTFNQIACCIMTTVYEVGDITNRNDCNHEGVKGICGLGTL